MKKTMQGRLAVLAAGSALVAALANLYVVLAFAFFTDGGHSLLAALE